MEKIRRCPNPGAYAKEAKDSPRRRRNRKLTGGPSPAARRARREREAQWRAVERRHGRRPRPNLPDLAFPSMSPGFWAGVKRIASRLRMDFRRSGER